MFMKSTLSGLSKKPSFDIGQVSSAGARIGAEQASYATKKSEMLALYRSLDSAFPEFRHKVILFVAANPGEGTSTIVTGLATAAAECLRAKVLILDACVDRPPPGHAFETGTGLEAFATPPADHSRSHALISRAPMFTSAFSEEADTQELAERLYKSRAEFELVLVDCAAISQSNLCFVLAPLSDGVALVVEADKTRSPVLETAISRMANVGARIVGAVLNKRQYYIPKRFYDLL